MFIKKFFLKILKPNFLENERYAWIIKNIRNLPKGSSIIDIGAGEQMFMGICEDLKYTSQDIAIYDGFGKEGLHTGTWDTSNIDIVSDATSIPVDDCSFDNALCTEVLEHAPYPVKILNEIYRILKPGGKLIISVPNLLRLNNRLRMLLGKPPKDPFKYSNDGRYHVREYAETELRQFFAPTDWEINRSKHLFYLFTRIIFLEKIKLSFTLLIF